MADSLLSTALAQARRWKRRVLLTVGGVVVLAVAVVLIDAWSGLGHSAHGARLERMQRSKQWKDGRFDNPQPLVNDSWGMLTGLLHVSPHATPAVAPETETADPRLFDAWPASGLRVSWFGHASMLIELDGVRVLTDPMWSERSSPLTWAGPKRWFPAPIALRDLPPIDAVVISHDHYDHLDRETIVALNRDTQALFIVPLGVGAHLAYWGVPEHPLWIWIGGRAEKSAKSKSSRRLPVTLRADTCSIKTPNYGRVTRWSALNIASISRATRGCSLR